MADNEDDYSDRTRDETLAAVYSPRDVPDFTSLLGIRSEVINTDVVRSTDYDELMARRSAPSAPVVAPGAPSVAPSAASVDLGTARTATGERIADPANLTGDSIVAFNGSETTVAVLMSLGLVSRNATTGMFQAATSGTPQVEQPQAQQPTPSQNTPLDDRSEAILTDVMTRAPATATGAATSFIAGDGVISDEAVHQISADLGLEPSQAREQIAHVTAAFSKEAAQMGAKAIGCTEAIAAEALEWARANHGPALKETAQRHWNEGRADYSGYVSDFVASLDQRDAQRILSANPIPGRAVHWDRNAGCVVVTLGDGTQMSWAAAVKGGFIGIR